VRVRGGKAVRGGGGGATRRGGARPPQRTGGGGGGGRHRGAPPHHRIRYSTVLYPHLTQKGVRAPSVSWIRQRGRRGAVHRGAAVARRPAQARSPTGGGGQTETKERKTLARAQPRACAVCAANRLASAARHTGPDARARADLSTYRPTGRPAHDNRVADSGRRGASGAPASPLPDRSGARRGWWPRRGQRAALWGWVRAPAGPNVASLSGRAVLVAAEWVPRRRETLGRNDCGWRHHPIGHGRARSCHGGGAPLTVTDGSGRGGRNVNPRAVTRLRHGRGGVTSAEGRGGCATRQPTSGRQTASWSCHCGGGGASRLARGPTSSWSTACGGRWRRGVAHSRRPRHTTAPPTPRRRWWGPRRRRRGGAGVPAVRQVAPLPPPRPRTAGAWTSADTGALGGGGTPTAVGRHRRARCLGRRHRRPPAAVKTGGPLVGGRVAPQRRGRSRQVQRGLVAVAAPHPRNAGPPPRHAAASRR